MIVVDSSGWIEFLQHTERAALFEPALTRPEAIFVPSISLFEVHRLISARVSSEAADAAVAPMLKCRVVPLDGGLALAASAIARNRRLSLADAIIYATAQLNGADLWTQDAHFEALPGVKYFRKA